MSVRTSEIVIREIRAEMARQRMGQRELASRMEPERAQPYVWRRLSGEVPLSMDDIESIAKVLGVSMLQLCQPPGHPAQSI
jgi:transcriptional regulator with XRE-family HTH domain